MMGIDRVLKILGLIFIIAIFLSTTVNSAQEVITFEWNANTEEDLAGYRIYASNKTNPTKPDVILVKTVEAPAITTSAVVSGSEGQTIYFVLTAFDEAGNESEFSDECPFTFEDTAPAKTGGFTCSRQEIQ